VLRITHLKPCIENLHLIEEQRKHYSL
jgi:hypothetical protein